MVDHVTAVTEHLQKENTSGSDQAVTMAQMVQTGFMKGVSLFFEYDTPKIVHIRSKKVGIINRLIQAVILAYIIGYAIVWEKGYQEFEDVVSAARSKVKGTIYTNFNMSEGNPLNHRIWDVADYVLPSQENDAFFVMTNVVLTQNQNQTTCPEDPSIAPCKVDKDCEAMEPTPNGNGVMTGKCKPIAPQSPNKSCEIHAWCPVENDVLPLGAEKALLGASETFTVLLKNNIKFPKFNVSRRNILDSQDKDYLHTCRYDKNNDKDRLCPIFELGKIVAEAKQDYQKMAVEGGIIEISITWDCNLDHSVDQCKPEYSFTRLDPEVAKISPGWNFRYANYYYENTSQMRDLYKAYGIRFVIKVTGRAGKFSLVPLLLSLGSGIGLLAIATVLCDMVVLYVLKKGNFYKEKKYFYVTDDDAFQPALLAGDNRSYNSMDQAENNVQDTSVSGQPVKRRGTPPDEDDKDQLIH